LICVHNHPSGDPEPSQEDLRITERLVEVGKLVGIPVLDHLFVGGDNYTSFADKGLL
jgi:DNA repair protein RadC